MSIVCLVYSYGSSVLSVQLCLQVAKCTYSRLLKHCLSSGVNVIKRFLITDVPDEKARPFVSYKHFLALCHILNVLWLA
jgi:hypothetical protein